MVQALYGHKIEPALHKSGWPEPLSFWLFVLFPPRRKSMRRIATLLATGAVAAVTLAASPANAATNTFSGTHMTTAGGSEVSAAATNAAATNHVWQTHGTTPAGVSGKGHYSFTKAKHLTLSGTVTDKRTGKYYACVRFKVLDAHGNGVILTVGNTVHGTTGTFRAYTANFRTYHLYIAKCDITKTGKTPKSTGSWFKRF
jgi:hypothetical protein